MAKQFFRDALRRRLIAENPFEGMKGCMVKGNAAREYFITPRRGRGGPGSLPGCAMAAVVRPESFRGSAVPFGALGLRWHDIDLGRQVQADTACSSIAPRRSITTARNLASCRSSRNCGRTWKRHGSRRKRGKYYVIPGVTTG